MRVPPSHTRHIIYEGDVHPTIQSCRFSRITRWPAQEYCVDLGPTSQHCPRLAVRHALLCHSTVRKSVPPSAKITVDAVLLDLSFSNLRILTQVFPQESVLPPLHVLTEWPQVLCRCQLANLSAHGSADFCRVSVVHAVVDARLCHLQFSALPRLDRCTEHRV